MHADDLTPAMLQELRSPQPQPVLTLTMPTHRSEPGSGQDAVRLRNLLAEASRRLESHGALSREDRTAMAAQLERAAADLDPRRGYLDGLVVFVSPESFSTWTVPHRVPERVVVDDTFLTRNLVAARAHARPFWVLTVAADGADLWSGSGEHLGEHTGYGFPRTATPAEEDVQRKQRAGDTPSAFGDEDTRQFLREVDTAVGEALAAEPRPLYLVGLPEALSLLEEVGTACRGAAGRLHKGGMTKGPAPALAAELRPVLAEHEARAAAEVDGRMDGARSRRTFAAGLDEVWGAVQEGRAGLVAVEDHYREAARIEDGHLVPLTAGEAAEADPSAVHEDVVDELVEAALETGAEVVFLPDGALAGHERITADLRY